MKKTKIVLICFALCIVSTLVSFADESHQMQKQQRLDNTVYLQDLNYSAAVDGELCVIEPEDKTVRPHFSENVFYVPLRFVVEKLGGAVLWEDSVKTVILNIDGNRVSLSTRYDTFSYNGIQDKLEYSCFIKNGFTYVALDDVIKLTGFKTYFYKTHNSAVVYSSDDWQPERDAEKQAHSAMEFAVSPFFKMFIN